MHTSDLHGEPGVNYFPATEPQPGEPDLAFDGAEFDDEDDWDDPNRSTVRAKWSMDGAMTLTEAAQKLRAFADDLLAMEADGWQLTERVNDDYGFIRKNVH
jgi:hypothetical protein